MRATTSDGLLLVDKPAGISSHDVVLAARRSLGERRIGHAGTLDPFATGLLVLLVGRATRLLPHIDGEPKVYRATLRFGAETETDDLHGDVTREAPLPSRASVEAAIPTLTGEISQVPPAYSAKRVGGRRAYAAARAGEDLELAPVRVRVDAWRVLAWREQELDAEITCGGGTYIRALARDLGRLVGSAAHLTALRRIRSGPFDVEDAVAYDALREGRPDLRSPLDALPSMPTETLTADDVARVVRGIDVPRTVDGARGALVDGRGVLVALAEARHDRWQPRVVMREAP